MAGIDELLRIMARLRDPERGCPWDLDQDFASISPHTIEEAYEVDEAVASGDLEALRDELGDLLFQVVFQARLAEELGAFDFDGVVEAIAGKLVRRHPHVFGDAATPSSVEGQREHWEALKQAEREAGHSPGDGPPDPFAGIPRRLPALARSAKIAGRLERLEPEAELDVAALRTELVAAERSLGSDPTPRSEIEAESDSREEQSRAVGRGLRAWARLARRLGVDPEQALRALDDELLAEKRAKRHQASPTPLR